LRGARHHGRHGAVKITELPFNRHVGIEPAPEPGALLRLPGGPQYLNHVGTVHASALLALAEATSGEFLLRQFGTSEGVLPLARRMEAKFRKPARGSVTSSASVPSEALARLDGDLQAKGRAIVEVHVELHDESGAHVLSATVEWFIQRIAPRPIS
jgi:acyl-coenzyme A thioesterase PaaI-like protein